MRLWIVVGIVVVAGAGIAYPIVRARYKTNGAAEADKTAVVARGDIRQAVSSSGRVVSNHDVDIKCRASGEVIKLPFDVSDHVKKGELLVEVDPADQQRRVRKAEAAVAESQARLAQAQANLNVAEQAVRTAGLRAEAAIGSAKARSESATARAERRRQLVAERLGSTEDAESADADAAVATAELATAKVQAEEVKTQSLALAVSRQAVALAQAQLESDQIDLEDERQQLAYTRVEAPIDGVVAARNVQVGTIISSGITNVGGGTTVMTLSDLSRVFVLASVDESDIGQIKVGQRAAVTVDAYPRVTFEGAVVQIAVKGVNTSNVVTFEVKVEVTSANKTLLKPEMTATVQTIEAERKQVLLIPSRALGRKGAAAAVTVVTGSGAEASREERAVKTGLTDGEQTEVIEGLREGESVRVRDEAVSKWANASAAEPPAPPPPGHP